jgi:hypothetical protein
MTATSVYDVQARRRRPVALEYSVDYASAALNKDRDSPETIRAISLQWGPLQRCRHAPTRSTVRQSKACDLTASERDAVANLH